MTVALRIVATAFAAWVLVRPVLTLAVSAFEAWGYAYMYHLSMNLGWRLAQYALAWTGVGAIPAILTWSLL